MYTDKRDVRYIRKATYLSEKEQDVIERAASATGRQPAAFMRDAAMVVSRYVLGQGANPDPLHAIQKRLHTPSANDDFSLFALAY